MKANELRVGNLVLIGGIMAKLCTILSVQEKLIGYNAPARKGECNIDWIESVPISEEWLLKFGFENHENYFWYKKENIFSNMLSAGIQNNDGVITIIENVKYVHQLQNLYFVLTGEELTFN